MNIEIVKNILVFFGGVGMFVYGMQVMAEGLQQAAGEKTRKLLEALTSNRLLGVLVGAAVTAIIQSSGATTVMVVGFVNARLLTLQQAVGVIMGANIGTTATAWIVSLSEWGAFLQPDMLAPLLLVLGVALIMVTKNERVKEGAKILVGFGLLFMGLATMSNTVTPYADAPIFVDAFKMIGGNPLLGLLVGAVVTAIMQSSSASMGILQTLALTGIVNWGSAVFIALGQNIGTCVVALISSVGTDTNAKRAAWIHLEFNVIGSLIIGTAAWIYFMYAPAMMHTHVTSTNLALFHSSFNVLTTVMLFPFANQLVQLSKLIVPEPKVSPEKPLVHMDERLITNGSVALQSMQQELTYMGKIALENIGYSRDALVSHNNFDSMVNNEEKIDTFYKELSGYAQRINTRALSEREMLEYRHFILALRDMEHISDRCVEIANIAKNYMGEVDFPENFVEDINTVSSQCEEMLKIALEMRTDYNPELIGRLKKLRNQIFSEDYFATSTKYTESSLSKDNMTSSMVFLEVMDRYERIANHARLLCHYIAREKEGKPIHKFYHEGDMA